MNDKPKCDLRRVVLLRHGENVWNKENRFTGWTDVDLSDYGKEEVGKAGGILKEHGITFDIDAGAKGLAGHPGEKITEGLDGMGDRLAEYARMGARFAKWRAVLAVDDDIPRRGCRLSAR